MATPPKPQEIKVKETHIYHWTCPICTGENEVRVSIQKVSLSCPICLVTFKRYSISDVSWTINGDRLRSEAPIDLEFVRS